MATGSRILTLASLMRLRVSVFVAVIAALSPAPAHAAAPIPPARLAAEFRAAGAAYGIPSRILAAIGYVNTRWRMPASPAADGGWGVMHLVENPSEHSLRRAARLTGIRARELRRDAAANVRGGAALLAAAAGHDRPAALAGWYPYVAEVGGGRVFADQVYAYLGVRTPTLAARAATTAPDYPNALWSAASSANYTTESRPVTERIDMVVIHVTQGSYAGTISWFRNSAAGASAHYVVRSSDGQVTQMVREKDVAWHAGNRTVNHESIGIEHEGYIDDCSWFTDAMYQSSAALTASLVRKYGIPVDRDHIIGHSEVPDPFNPGQFGGADHHRDPGPCWDWDKYMALVRALVPTDPPYTQIVDNDDPARFSASDDWGTSSWNPQHRRADYRYTTPEYVSDPARFKLDVPETGKYAVYAWWPASPGYVSSARYGIATTGGRVWVRVNEQRNGGRWNYLGTFELGAGDAWKVRVSHWTRATGYIVADAVKIVRR
jgi:N-acetyl-anhydromuramyl-L-alanine amidase AmpD